MVKALKLEAKDGKVFKDTANHWAKDFIATAAAYGIIGGYDGDTFGPNDPITREQMVVVIAKAAKLDKAVNGKEFTDSKEISSWAREAVASVIARGIITGYPDKSFRPKGKLSRAEAVTAVVKAMKQ